MMSARIQNLERVIASELLALKSYLEKFHQSVWKFVVILIGLSMFVGMSFGVVTLLLQGVWLSLFVISCGFITLIAQGYTLVTHQRIRKQAIRMVEQLHELQRDLAKTKRAWEGWIPASEFSLLTTRLTKIRNKGSRVLRILPDSAFDFPRIG